MNKKNKILVGCLALLLALSVGYALFSDTITINGTATAKGSFDITATCETGISSKIGTAGSLGWPNEGGYENDACTVNDDVISMNTSFLYPGARRYFTIKVTNTGSIDAILYFSKILYQDQICVSDDENGTNKRCANGTRLEGFYGNYSPVDSFVGMNNKYGGIILEDKEGNIITFDEMVSTGLYDTTNNFIKLNVGYSLYRTYHATVDFDSPNPYTANKMYVDVNNVNTYTFEQATN